MISKTLKRLRENNGYTQQQVADALNVERSTYTYYENGKTTPDIETIIRLAKIFNVSYVDILAEEDRYLKAKLDDVDVDSLDFAYNNSHISNYTYELTKEEKRLIASYRVLPKEIKEKILKSIFSETKKIPRKNKGK